MANILDDLEKEALKFMDKRLSIENNFKDSIIEQLDLTKKDIEFYLKRQDSVNLFYLNTMLEQDIKSIIQRRRDISIRLTEDAINNNYNSGLEQANRFIVMSGEQSDPIFFEQDKSQEALAALLLFARNLINSLYDELVREVNNNLVNAFILSKNKDSPFNDEERDTEPDKAFNVILTGTVLAGQVGFAFNRISKRAETISKTEVNRALNYGLIVAYISAKREITELRVKWVEVKDMRLCQHCKQRAEGGLDGDGVYSIDSISPPPLHPNCRCVLVPFLYRWFL